MPVTIYSAQKGVVTVTSTPRGRVPALVTRSRIVMDCSWRTSSPTARGNK